MRRNWGRQSRRTRSSADWISPLCVEALEDRLALSHAPLAYEPMAWSSPPGATPMVHDYAEMSFGSFTEQSRFEQPRGDFYAHDTLHGPDTFSGPDTQYRADFSAAPGRDMPPMVHGFSAGPVYQSTTIIVQIIVVQEGVIFTPPASSPAGPAPRAKPDAQVGRLSAVGDDGDPPASSVNNQARASAAAVSAARPSQPSDAGIASGLAATSNAASVAQPTPLLASGVAGSTRVNGEASPLSPFDSGAKPFLEWHARLAEGEAENTDETHGVPESTADVAAGQADSATTMEVAVSPTESVFPASDLSRAALLASVSLNIEAVDEAFEAVMREVEKLGGEIVTWFDELNMPSWVIASATAAFLGFGGHCYLKRRGARLGEQAGEEESSSWLFTRLQTPPGQL